MSKIEWIIIEGPTDAGKAPIGAVGFVNNKAATVVSFFDDRDGNKDGNVSWGEWLADKISPISAKGITVVEVSQIAKYDRRIWNRDPSFQQMAINLFRDFTRRLVLDGVYAVYVSKGVEMGAAGVARRITSNAIKQFAIRKGMESAVEKALKSL